MPHVELKYSDGLVINTGEVFDAVENVINEYDPSSGVCKSRAYPASLYKHTHLFVSVVLLKKAHRNVEFSKGLANQLEKAVKRLLSEDCYFSLSLDYVSDYYITNQYRIEKNC